MAFIPAPNCVEVVIRGIWGGQVVAITLSFCRADSISEDEMDDLNDALFLWLANELAPVLSEDIGFNNINITDQTTDSAPSIDYAISPVLEGSAVGGSVPNNVTLVTKFGTALRGRSYRGRVYTPGMDNDALISSTAASTTAVNNLTAAYAELPGAVEPLGWSHVVISRRHNNANRVTAVSTPITDYSTEQFLDSQRRRLVGRGD